MINNKKAFQAEGIVLKGNTSDKIYSNNLQYFNDVNVGIFTDKFGNLVFIDEYVKNILGKEYVTLRELFIKNRGIFTRTNKDGKVELVFKDETVSRPYTLSEIINASQLWRKFLTSGSLWWIGGLDFDHRNCANLPRFGDENGQNILWSVDRYIHDLYKFNNCSSFDLNNIFVDNKTQQPKWYDVQNLEIVLPPTDRYKVMLLTAKLSFSSYNCDDPIFFRFYDATLGVELTRVAVVQSNKGKLLHPVYLCYFGPVPYVNRSQRFTNPTMINNDLSCEKDCGCSEPSCQDIDPYCSTETVGSKQIFTSGSHIIKVQFHITAYHNNHYERVFGLEYDNNGIVEYITTSTIDCVIFNTSPDSRYTRQQGTIEFNGETEKKVLFKQPLSTNNYIINLTPNHNINCWYTAKSSTGFTIKCEMPFRGLVDWVTINNNEGM